MDYLERYRSRVFRNTNNIREKEKNELILEFEKYLHESLTAHEVTYSKVNEFPSLDFNEKELMIINEISENDKKALDEKFLLTRLSTNIEVGCYVYWQDNWWVLISQDKDALESYKKFTMRRCNQYFNYVYKGELYKIPISIENLTLYSDGLQDIRYVSYGDAKNRVVFGSNIITNTIDVGTRMMISNRVVYRITNINDFEQNGKATGDKGAVTVLILQTAIIKEDDLENNIAYNKLSIEEPDINEIEGKDSINLGEKNTYSIDYNNEVEYSIDTNIDEITLTQTGNKCYIKVSNDMNLIGESILLIVKDKDTDQTIDMKTIIIRGN